METQQLRKFILESTCLTIFRLVVLAACACVCAVGNAWAAHVTVKKVQPDEGAGVMGSYMEGQAIGVVEPLPVTVHRGKPKRDDYEPGDSEKNPAGMYDTLWNPFTRFLDELLPLLKKKQSANLFDLPFKDPLLLPYVGLLIKELYSDQWSDLIIPGHQHYTRSTIMRWRLTLEFRMQQHGVWVDLASWANESMIFLATSQDMFQKAGDIYQLPPNLVVSTHGKPRAGGSAQQGIDKKSLLFYLADEYKNLMTSADIWEEGVDTPPRRKKPKKTLPTYSLEEFSSAPNDPFHMKSFIYAFKTALYSTLLPKSHRLWLEEHLEYTHGLAQGIFTLTHDGKDVSWREWLDEFPTPESLLPPSLNSGSEESDEDSGSGAQNPQEPDESVTNATPETVSTVGMTMPASMPATTTVVSSGWAGWAGDVGTAVIMPVRVPYQAPATLPAGRHKLRVETTGALLSPSSIAPPAMAISPFSNAPNQIHPLSLSIIPRTPQGGITTPDIIDLITKGQF